MKSLAESIRTQGLLQPIGINENNELAFGKRRLLACRDVLGWTTIPATVVNVTSLVEAEHDENELRLAFSPMERVAIARLVKVEMDRRAGRPKKNEGEIPAELPEFPKGTETRDIAAKKAGFSSATILRYAETVHDKGSPELKEAVDSGKIKLTAAKHIAQLPKPDQKLIVENNGKKPSRRPEARQKYETLTIHADKLGNEMCGLAKKSAEEFRKPALIP